MPLQTGAKRKVVQYFIGKTLPAVHRYVYSDYSPAQILHKYCTNTAQILHKYCRSRNMDYPVYSDIASDGSRGGKLTGDNLCERSKNVAWPAPQHACANRHRGSRGL